MAYESKQVELLKICTSFVLLQCQDEDTSARKGSISVLEFQFNLTELLLITQEH